MFMRRCFRALEDFDRIDRADAVNVPQRNVYALVRRNFHTNDTCHNSLIKLNA